MYYLACSFPRVVCCAMLFPGDPALLRKVPPGSLGRNGSVAAWPTRPPCRASPFTPYPCSWEYLVHSPSARWLVTAHHLPPFTRHSFPLSPTPWLDQKSHASLECRTPLLLKTHPCHCQSSPGPVSCASHTLLHIIVAPIEPSFSRLYCHRSLLKVKVPIDRIPLNHRFSTQQGGGSFYLNQPTLTWHRICRHRESQGRPASSTQTPRRSSLRPTLWNCRSDPITTDHGISHPSREP